jgi:hypothetical protein
MKRAANLFDRIYEHENLRLAFHKAARGRRGHAVVRQFAANADSYIAAMSAAICEGTFPVGRFQQFLIRDPKERVITAPCFDERVLHHAIMNICEPAMDRWLIDDTFACRRGKGREAAIRRAKGFTSKSEWFLKLDVRKCFDSVSHARLLGLLECRFKDCRLLELLQRIISSYRGPQGAGLPIGSLTSQHFANFYLGWLDRLVKDSLRLRGYVRYMDDMVLWHPSREALIDVHARCEEFAALRLALDIKPSAVRRANGGVPFLGCQVFPTHVELSGRSKRRWRNRVRVLQRGERLGLISQRELQVRLTSLAAFAKGAGVKSWRFRNSVLQPLAVNDP